tara:strand:- start:20 stop:580 length:561 start_codon:yes stop_codon:yes gene_type:complete
MQRLAVYCGSRSGHDSAFASAAEVLGETLVRHGVGLVYGAAQIGLMGVVADTVLKLGGEVIGVMPRALLEKEIVHPQLSQLELVDSMHQRKARMSELADGMVALPGGFGTLEELFEALTWLQLGLHEKPIGLMNVAGFFDPLLQFLDASVDKGFLSPQHRQLLRHHSDAELLLQDLLKQNRCDAPS